MTGPILVLGARGQVGSELLALAKSRGIDAVGLARADVDITDRAAVEAVVRAAAPCMVVNAAAYTAVDRAESEEALAFAANSLGAETVARAAAAAGCPVVHLSTDYVFDGTKIDPYVETDPTAPLGVYGRSKAEGEANVRLANPRHFVVRTAWVYGQFGGNFLKTMLRLARERDALRIVADQRGCPTSTQDIAEAILAIDRAVTNGETRFGTYHFGGTGATTWHEFAGAIVAAQADATGRRPPVIAIASADYPTPARRPANSVLDSSLFARVFGIRAQDWRTRTEQTVVALLEQMRAKA
jgi:dTDP-4-dehydrorhamnose reductase